MATEKKKGEIIVKHDFENAKKELQKFSNSTTTPKELSKVDTNSGLFGVISHKVTGSELNRLTSEIQEYLISFNKLHIKIIKEFGQVYNAFEALDKDYIKAIQINMEAIFKTNTELKDAQSDIKSVIDIQKKTLETLKKFKENLEKYKHLEDVDEIWISLKEAEKQISGCTKTLNVVENYVKTLKEIKHLNDVDELWETSRATDKNIGELLESIKLLQERIGKHSDMLLEISSYIDRLQKFSHLDSIDELWDKCDSIKNQLDRCLNELDEMRNSKVQLEKTIEDQKIYFNKKLNISYAVAGGSTLLLLIEVILHFTGVI